MGVNELPVRWVVTRQALRVKNEAQWPCYRNRGDRKRQAKLGDAEQQGLFSTGAGTVESPPEAEHLGASFWVSFIWRGLLGPTDFPA